MAGPLTPTNTYTFTQKSEGVEPGQETYFGGLVNDANHNALTGFTANGPMTSDISASVLTSPQTVANNAVTTFTIPLNATQMNLYVTTEPVTFSESSSSVATGFTIPTGVFVTIPVARVKYLYFEGVGGSATVNFWFDVV